MDCNSARLGEAAEQRAGGHLLKLATQAAPASCLLIPCALGVELAGHLLPRVISTSWRKSIEPFFLVSAGNRAQSVRFSKRGHIVIHEPQQFGVGIGFHCGARRSPLRAVAAAGCFSASAVARATGKAPAPMAAVLVAMFMMTLLCVMLNFAGGDDRW